jgi:signal transduction histidine kinase
MITKRPTTILIVDDVPSNVSVLFDFLTTHDFEVSVAQSGESALQLVDYEIPDLILLDVMMPGMDGLETCQQFKSNPKTQAIPIIFMTALAETIDKIKGFQAGAVDYITKPFQQEEVLARINTHLTIHQLQQQLHEKNSTLELQNIELAAKNTELDTFARTVAHDLKNPLQSLVGFADLLLDTLVARIESEELEYLQYISQSGQKMLEIIDSLLLLARVSQQEIESTPLNMPEIITQVQQRLAPLIKACQGEIILPADWPIAQGYALWVEEIWVNYLSNGLKYSGQPPRLELGATPHKNKIRFWVRDNGTGLSLPDQTKLFHPFIRLSQNQTQEGHGLGLSIVRRIVERLGGEVGIESQPGQGCLFYFTLPALT